MIKIIFIGILIKSGFIFLNVFYFIDVIFILNFLNIQKKNNIFKIIILGLIQDLLFESYLGLNVFIYCLCYLFNKNFERNFNIGNKSAKILNYFILSLIKTTALYIFYNIYIGVTTFSFIFNLVIYFLFFICLDLVLKFDEKK